MLIQVDPYGRESWFDHMQNEREWWHKYRVRQRYGGHRCSEWDIRETVTRGRNDFVRHRKLPNDWVSGRRELGPIGAETRTPDPFPRSYPPTPLWELTYYPLRHWQPEWRQRPM